MNTVTAPAFADRIPTITPPTETELRVMLADLMGVCSSAASLLETRAPHLATVLNDRAARADALLQRGRA